MKTLNSIVPLVVTKKGRNNFCKSVVAWQFVQKTGCLSNHDNDVKKQLILREKNSSARASRCFGYFLNVY